MAEAIQRSYNDDEIKDLVEIMQLSSKYIHSFDARDGQAYAACWTEDGFMERKDYLPNWRGKKQLAALAEGFPVNGLHLTTDLLIELDGDTATMKSNLLYLDMGPPCEVSMAGIYHDQLERTSEGWKFKVRRFEVHVIRDSEVSEDFAAAVTKAASA